MEVVVIAGLVLMGLAIGFAGTSAKKLGTHTTFHLLILTSMIVSIVASAVLGEPWWLAVPLLFIGFIVGGTVFNLMFIQFIRAAGSPTFARIAYEQHAADDDDDELGSMIHKIDGYKGFSYLITVIGLIAFGTALAHEWHWI